MLVVHRAGRFTIVEPWLLCLANCQIIKHFVGFALQLCDARSGRPVSPSPGDGRQTRRFPRRAFRGGRVRPRPGATADAQSVPAKFRERPDPPHALAPPSSADTAEISPAVLNDLFGRPECCRY